MHSKIAHTGILGLRVVQLISVASVITGFIWSTSDLLLVSVLVGAPVTPLSVLMMLYGSVGLFVSELSVRLLRRKSKGFLSQEPTPNT